MTMKNDKLLVPLRTPVTLVVFLGVFISALPVSAQAQGWRLEPIIKAGVVSDDNARLSIRTDEEVDLNGNVLDARADIYYDSSDITSFSFQPRVTKRTYSGDSAFDSDEFFLRSHFRHRGQSSTFGFGVNFDQQPVRTAERSESDLDIDNPDEIAIDDTGLVGLDGERSRWRLAPYWNYRLSNTSSLNVELDYANTQYDETFSGALVDFADTRVNLGYSRSLSNTTTGIVRLTGRRYEPDLLANDNTGYGVAAGIERALSDTTNLVAMIGVESTEQPGGQSDSELIGDITLTRDLEIISMFARYQRAVTGSGTGTVEVRDTVNMNFNRRLNEKISAGLGVRSYHAERVGATSSAGDRNYVQLESKFTWYLSKAFLLEANYRYTIMDRSSAIGERANSNQVGLWIVYQPNTTPKL